jgi:phosphoribosyl 1,2-cyclic phosphodiesterase
LLAGRTPSQSAHAFITPHNPSFPYFWAAMSLFIASLNSGSNGNCYYIGNGKEAVLIDAGISCRETERRMKQLGLALSTVKAIFVSHEHSDHITGVPGIAKKYQLPVYITAPTFTAAKIPVEQNLVFPFAANQPVAIGELSVTAFRKFHDAADPHSFVVSGNGISIGVFTDIGHACTQVAEQFSRCHAVFLEANYCEELLSKSSYPAFLKQRISSDEGHLSNAQALKLFAAHRSPQLSRLILSHLSKNNNTPQLVEKIFEQQAGSTSITVASRYEASPVFCISRVDNAVSEKKIVPAAKVQLSLF